MKKSLFVMITLLAAASCGRQTEKVPAISLSDLDTTVAPGQDFYLYANGGWMKNNPLKPEYSRYGSFDMLAENNEIRLNDLFKAMAEKKYRNGTVEQKISDLYKMGLDSVRLNNEGCNPVKEKLALPASVADASGLASLVASLHGEGESVLFDAGVMADLMDSETQILYLSQSGLGMGDREYYVNPKNAELHEGYRKMIAGILGVCGVEEADGFADAAVRTEDTLAGFSWTKEDNRDYTKLYNPMSTAEIIAAYPGFDFKTYFTERGIPDQQKIIVCQPSYFKGLSDFLAAGSMDDVKAYMTSMIAQGAAGSLSDDIYAGYFDFFSRQMSGIKEMKPRWKRAMAVPNGILGEAVGKMYVAKYFPEEQKEKVLEIVENLRTALGQHIAALTWMSDSTKAYAQDKLAAFTVKIGYPDKWKDYSSLDINTGRSYYENLVNASKWYVKDNLDKLGKPTDHSEWGMTPQTVNAYYDPSSNEICFPAAILQAPFYNPDADDAVNYGAIGVVIGHEMTHGFDDQGRLFDKKGNMTNWWTDEDSERFKALSEKLVAQYSAVEVLPGVFANGVLSLGENIADQGGVGVAYSAFRNSLAGSEPAPIDGLSADRRFFLGYAHVWAQNITEQEIARRTNMDVHSLGNNRVNVTLRNFQTFFDAFGIKEGDAMWRPEEDRVIIW